MAAESGTRVPTVNIKSILACKRSLEARLALFTNRRADAIHLHMMADAICLISKRYARSAVVETLRPLAGSTLTPEVLKPLAAKIAGNGDMLLAGDAVPLVYTPAVSALDNALLYISRVQLARDRFGKVLNELHLESFTGRTSGASFIWGVPRGTANVIARRVGFSAPWERYPFIDPMQLSGIFMYTSVSGSDYSADPAVREVLESTPVVKYNRDTVLRLRCRAGVSCPNNLTNTCHMCAVGRDRCPAAVHSITYAFGNCTACNDPAAIFDPEASQVLCIVCDKRLRLHTNESPT